MGKVAFVFPGQGAQYAGMGKDFYKNSKISRQIFQKAGQILGFSMEELCFEENEKLNLTEYTQAALLAVTIAMLKEVEQRGFFPDVTAGLSLGEYSALVSCQALKFEDAINVVRQRGIFMEKAVPQGEGMMAAVLGLTSEEIDDVLQFIEDVEVANYNCPGQIVISGKSSQMEQAFAALKERGAKRVVKLKVSGPFHSKLLVPAGEALQEVLQTVSVKEHKIPYVANVTASYITGTKQVKELLAQQVSTSVRWQQSVEQMIANGVEYFVEIGPGTTLSSLIKKISHQCAVYNVNTWDSLDGLTEFLNRRSTC